MSGLYWQDGIPERIKDEDVASMVEEYKKTRCPKLKEKLIEGHIRLAISVAGYFVSISSIRKDDLIQSSLLGLTQAVEWVPDRLKDNNIAPYIVVTVKRFIRDFLNRDHLIPIEKTAYKKLCEKHGGIGFLPYFNTIDKADVEYDDDNFIDRTPAIQDDLSYLWMTEFFQYLHKGDEKYKKIINYLMEDYNQVEIAEKMGVSKQAINQSVTIIRSRVEYWRKNYEDN